MLYAFLRLLAAMVSRLLFRLERLGVEHVPRRGRVLLVANHQSVLDPPVIGAATPRPLAFLAKAELFRIPVFAALLRMVNVRPLRREGSDPSALRMALRVLEEERALLLFPEGTRGEEGVLRPAKAGAGMLAVLSGAPVVPVYVRGTGDAWPRGRRLPRPTKVFVTFGEPLLFARRPGEDRKDYYAAVSREMMEAIRRLRDGTDPPGAARGEARRHDEIRAGVTRA